MDFSELVHHLCQRPGMWVSPPYLSSVRAFISGYDLARDGGPLAGFREWLIIRADAGNNLAWEGLVALLLLPDKASINTLTPDQEANYLQRMAELFDEFFRFREEHGLTKVHYDYARWLLRKRWYTGSLRKKHDGST